MTRNRDIVANYKALFELLRAQRVLLAYEGLFDQELVKGFLSMTEEALSDEKVEGAVKKKFINVMVESLQNVCKHQSGNDDSQPAIFTLSADAGNYYVNTGNIVSNDRVAQLRERLDYLNQLDSSELKELYKQVRLNGTISSVGGAGLGFIDIIRKTGNKLLYELRPVTDTTSFFTLTSTISIEPK
jgi:hypothetical protein